MTTQSGKEDNMEKREHLGSRLGFILLSAGCAIGIGNVWKFPYMAGQNGGGIFVLIYFACLILLGIPVMTMEFAVGRASQKSPVKMYQEIEPKGSKWHIHGGFAFVGSYLLMMFYSMVSGWLIKYCVDSIRGMFVGLDKAGIEGVFGSMLAEPWTMIVYTFIVVVIGFLVCSFGLQKGLERVTKVMMIALLVIMVALAINSFTMEGGRAGLEFYLLPDIARFKEIGAGRVIVNAMNQAFFTLSLGIGSMAIFGSYLGKDRALMGESINVAILDTFVAVTSGFIIFPACFANGVQPDSGPNLIFITLPHLFNSLPLGRVIGSFFFLFLSFAALSTIFAVYELIIASTTDWLKCSRKKACLINGIAMTVLSLPAILGFNVLSDVNILGKGIMDMEDFLVSNVLLPLGSLTFVLFCTSKRGWGWKNFMEEANTGKGVKVRKWMYGYVKYVIPVIILVLFIVGLIDFF